MEDGWSSVREALDELKEYARSQRLDGEAARGKQAVDLNKTAKWADEQDDAQETEGPAQAEEELNALANVQCFYCHKKGHYTSKCPLKKAHMGEGKGKGKGKGK